MPDYAGGLLYQFYPNLLYLVFYFLTLNQSDYDGRTALHLAVCENHIEIVQFLLNIAKVNKNPKDRWNKTPLDEAIKLNHTEIIDLLQ